MFPYGMLQFRQPAVDRITFQQIFLQYTVRPTAEKGSIPAVYPISDRKNGIKVIKLGDVLLFSIISPYVPKWNMCSLSSSPAAVYVVQMFGNGRSFCPEEYGYLLLSQPHRFFLKPYPYLHFVIRLIQMISLDSP